MTLLIFSALFFFAGTFILTAFTSSLRRFQKRNSKKELKALGNLFFYRVLHVKFIPEHEYEGIYYATLTALNFCRFLLAASVTCLFLMANEWIHAYLIVAIPVLIILLMITFVVTDYIPRAIGNHYPKQTLWSSASIASFYLTLAFPFSFLLIKISEKLTRSVTFDYLHEPFAEGKQEIYEIIQESDVDTKLEPQDKQLIQSVVSFQDLVVKEVMVPRVDLFSLPANTPIKVAAKKLMEEGYSRTPVYKNTIDHIVGLLMYKDLHAKYMEAEEKKDPSLLNQPIETLVKPVLYTPETKKISHLLQEFKKRQMHMAIVVDEYGGTEGIVTFEDILEEIVGDIEDEYDTEEEEFTKLSDGSYLVDPRMSLVNIESELNIDIPEEGDYDTLGGYIFHVAGEIPPRGFIIKQNDFELEVLRVSDRAIQKVKIKPLSK